MKGSFKKWKVVQRKWWKCSDNVDVFSQFTWPRGVTGGWTRSGINHCSAPAKAHYSPLFTFITLSSSTPSRHTSVHRHLAPLSLLHRTSHLHPTSSVSTIAINFCLCPDPTSVPLLQTGPACELARLYLTECLQNVIDWLMLVQFKAFSFSFKSSSGAGRGVWVRLMMSHA